MKVIEPAKLNQMDPQVLESFASLDKYGDVIGREPKKLTITQPELEVLQAFAALAKKFERVGDANSNEMTYMAATQPIILKAMATSADNIEVEGLTRGELDNLLETIRGQKPVTNNPEQA